MSARVKRIFPSGYSSEPITVPPGELFYFEVENSFGSDILLVDCAKDDSRVRVFKTQIDELPKDPAAKTEFLKRQRVTKNLVDLLIGPSAPQPIELHDIDDGTFEIEVMHIRWPKPPV